MTAPKSPNGSILSIAELEVGNFLTYLGTDDNYYRFDVTGRDEDRGLPIVEVSARGDSQIVSRLNAAKMVGVLIGSHDDWGGDDCMDSLHPGELVKGDKWVSVEMVEEGELIFGALPFPKSKPLIG